MGGIIAHPDSGRLRCNASSHLWATLRRVRSRPARTAHVKLLVARPPAVMRANTCCFSRPRTAVGAGSSRARVSIDLRRRRWWRTPRITRLLLLLLLLLPLPGLLLRRLPRLRPLLPRLLGWLALPASWRGVQLSRLTGVQSRPED